jgi:hypothetical protein
MANGLRRVFVRKICRTIFTPIRVTVRVTCCAQRLLEMYIKRIADRARIVTHFAIEQSFLNESVDLPFAYLNCQAT